MNVFLISTYISLCMYMKYFVLGFDEIKIGVKYKVDGVEVDGMPSSLDQYSRVEVQYETMPGWTEDISKAQRFEDLPVNCRAYVLRLEQLIGVPVRWVGVGASRTSMIDRYPPIH